VVGKLTTILRRLLSAPSNHVVIFHYHYTVPAKTLETGGRVHILFQELNGAIDQPSPQSSKTLELAAACAFSTRARLASISVTSPIVGSCKATTAFIRMR